MEQNASGEISVRSRRLLVEHGELIDKAIHRAVRDALYLHKRAGNPVAIWRDDKVVLLQPEEILLEAKDGK